MEVEKFEVKLPRGVTGEAAPCLGDFPPPPDLDEESNTDGPKSMEDPET